MNKAYFEEMHKLGHDDELRYRLLIRGVKKLLEDQKKQRVKRTRLLNIHKKKAPQAANWS
ncbi:MULTISPECIES: hypothetical protein [Paenibacillus]|uniref:Uncharacterized protein n=1 Tax=Paenibacillus xylanilyticus TaxID=248903 RepID=A0A7Y6BWC0_9BACL|nr:hypothetical protein [Paenibacillus xylanilyticus]NUU75676.1 hypothetical protein [Paenibacillus xylanilyticus]